MNQIIGEIEKEERGREGKREGREKKKKGRKKHNVYNRAIWFDYESILHFKMLLIIIS